MHYFAIVLLPPDTPHDAIEALLAIQLAPFSEERRQCDVDGETIGNPGVHFWDWYRIGGRWDGKIRGQRDTTETPGCRCERVEGGISLGGDSGECAYSKLHDQAQYNAIRVMDMGECRPFTIVTLDGQVSHRHHWVPDPESTYASFPWKIAENPEHDRFVSEALLANREAIAVGVDYHN